jgi:opacity protein-like surface antigen
MFVHALLIAAAFAPSNTSWEAGVAPSYVRGGSFDGPGIAAHYLWAPNDSLALGPIVDFAYLSSGLVAGNRLPASYAFTSTFAGGLAQLRLPLRFVEPYAGLGVGYVAVDKRRSVNAQCAFGSGFGMLLAAGAKAAVSNHLILGLRGSARTPAFEMSCASVFGPAAFDMPVLFAVGGTLDYRW